jgi:UDP-N-acetylglucosamine 2-epimerase (non-hydrolysing)/GDP/UDP-N,N'-diacetylbacillosamine 2-epimerase (hydrolysing)
VGVPAIAARRRIAVITGTRATYGYNRRIMKLMHGSPRVELAVIVTGMHLLKEYGLTVREVERDGLPIAARVDMVIGGDTPTAFAKSLGVEIEGMAQVYDMVRPEIVLVSGDRGEMLAATLTAAYMNIPVAHLQSGDLSGHIDGSARHAITKLCHLHFPACEDSARRVERMGEEPWRIHNVGAPQLDEVIHGPRLAPEALASMLDLRLGEPIVVVLQHAVLAEVEQARAQMVETMEAIKRLGLQTLVIYPNVDAAGQEIIDVIHEYKRLPHLKAVANIDRQVFLSLLTVTSVLVGNSSCGILEAPSFKLPAINLGTRQRGRMQASNVINAEHDRTAIAAAIETALGGAEFRRQLADCLNPYGDGHSSERVVQILTEVPIDQRLLDKRMTY